MHFNLKTDKDESTLQWLQIIVGDMIVCTVPLTQDEREIIARLLLASIDTTDAHNLACDFILPD